VCIELGPNPQEYVVNSLAPFRLDIERLPALAAPGGNVRLLHINIVEM